MGIAIAAAAYLVLVASGRGLLTQFQATIDELGSEVTVQQAGVAIPDMSRISPDLIAALEGLEEVVGVSPIAIGITKVSFSSHFFVFGAEPTGRLLQRVRVVDGTLPRGDSMDIMIGRSAATRLELSPGDVVEIVGRHRFTVSGIYETGHGLYDNACIADLAAVQFAFKMGDEVNLVFLDLVPGASADEVSASIRERWIDLEASPSELWISTFQQVKIIEDFARYLALIALLIATFGVANTLNMSVAERTAEIGILRAIGWRKQRIAVTLYLEGLVLTFVGGCLGIPLSLFSLRVLRAANTLGFVPETPHFDVILEGLLLVLAAGTLGSIQGLMTIMRFRPAEALRFS